MGEGVIILNGVSEPTAPASDQLKIYKITGSDIIYAKTSGGGLLPLTPEVLNKFDATTAPTADDDSGDGYAIGSHWIDITNQIAYICEDATSTAAVWLVAAGVQQTELTDELTTVTFSAPGTPDYAVADLVNPGFGFTTSDEAQTILSVIANLQIRVNELETKLVAYGILVDAD